MASVFPNTCQVIKISGFFIENVDNDALEIDERPVRVLMSLDMVRLKTGFVSRKKGSPTRKVRIWPLRMPEKRSSVSISPTVTNIPAMNMPEAMPTTLPST